MPKHSFSKKVTRRSQTEKERGNIHSVIKLSENEIILPLTTFKHIEFTEHHFCTSERVDRSVRQSVRSFTTVKNSLKNNDPKFHPRGTPDVTRIFLVMKPL